jgi:mannan endo-1,4-beta-mannosidase
MPTRLSITTTKTPAPLWGLLVTAVLAGLGLLCFGRPIAEAQAASLVAELETGRLVGVDAATAIAGFSGPGYVTGFDQDGDAAEARVRIPRAGAYEVRIRYNSPFGEKGYDLSVGGTPLGGTFARTGQAGWAEISGGKVALSAGEHVVRLGKGWGWFSVDRVTLTPTRVVAPGAPRDGLSDPKATPEARALFAWLKAQYGRRIIAGQQLGGQADLDAISAASGEQPALRGYDLMDYSPSRRERGAEPGDMTERAVEWGKQGLVTLSWHWNAPSGLLDSPGKEWWRGFYTTASSFDLAAALDAPASEDYALLLRDMDAIAHELRKFRRARVPVLWRPLHEASGRWFWWGAKGPEPFKRLWRLMHQRFTQKHRLHNLIWVLSNGPSDATWYPGDDVVDIIGWDQYEAEGTRAAVGAAEWEALLAASGGRKLLAMTENGTVPDPQDMRALQARWLWFCTWGGMIGDPKWNSSEGIAEAFQDKDTIVLGDLKRHGWPAEVGDAAPGHGH